MEKQLQELSEITAAFRERVVDLQNLAGAVTQLSGQIAKISNTIGKSDRYLNESKIIPSVKQQGANVITGKMPDNLSNIIPFPNRFRVMEKNTAPTAQKKERNSGSLLFLSGPGSRLPAGIPDFRSALQRDGLILLGWDSRRTEEGYRLTAYWVTSAGIPRFYASRLLPAEDFSSARPDHKSYAAEDGIEFYGQDAPDYLVHVAPELMKSNPNHGKLRQSHISKLKAQGINVDFDHKYLLKDEKNLNLPRKKGKKSPPYLAGA